MSVDRKTADTRLRRRRIPPASSGEGFGRLVRPPHPVLVDLLYAPALESDLTHDLPHVLDIDAAHTVMLAKARVLPADIAAQVLSVNREFLDRFHSGRDVIARHEQNRGLYLALEQQFVAQLGLDVGGASHLARSRNDINATVTRMRLRVQLLSLLGACQDLGTAMGAVARRHVQTVMAAYTHLQPAQPTTLAHYLTAILSELMRAIVRLADEYEDVNDCPMGAGAGQGTSIPIDREAVARLLGFRRPIDNSLDAVASRDYVLCVLALLTSIGMTLTRLAVDLQTWSSVAYGLVDWPDDLVSTSSMMPQKRNAFVWENVRGKAAAAQGAFVAASTAMKNTPFANSVEISAEATSHLWPALDSVRSAIRLTALLLATMRVDIDAMRARHQEAGTTMTALADHLVLAHQLSFRAAHTVVSRTLQRVTLAGASPRAICSALNAEIRGHTRRNVVLSEDAVADVLDVTRCVDAARFGGGPSGATVDTQLQALEHQQGVLGQRLERYHIGLAEAARALQQAIDAIVAGATT